MGNSPVVDGRAPVHAFYSTRSWIEGNATQQLEAVASLPGIKSVAGMPDLHPGKYGPVGCSILAEQIHPQFVGSDIGCGMGLFQLDLAARKLRVDKAAERLRALDAPWDGDVASVLTEAGSASMPFDGSLGTIGGGNHFCELQAIEELIEPDVAARTGLDRALAYVLVHSGSRGLGYSILQQQLAAGAVTLDPASAAGGAYLAEHDAAVRWAALNRRVIATRTARAVRAECRGSRISATTWWRLAAPVCCIARGQRLPTEASFPSLDRAARCPIWSSRWPRRRPETLASLAHGAGRKFDRASMHGRIRTGKSDRAQLARNPFGGVIVCEDRDLLVEEAPEAYKSIDRVIADLADFGLARVVATFRPLVTFKTAHAASNKREGKPEREDRR